MWIPNIFTIFVFYKSEAAPKFNGGKWLCYFYWEFSSLLVSPGLLFGKKKIFFLLPYPRPKWISCSVTFFNDISYRTIKVDNYLIDIFVTAIVSSKYQVIQRPGRSSKLITKEEMKQVMKNKVANFRTKNRQLMKWPDQELGMNRFFFSVFWWSGLGNNFVFF